MSISRFAALLPLLALLLSASPASAAHHTVNDDVAKALAGIEEKLVGLAEATPDGKFSYKPTPEVRSTSEVFMHVAAANYFLAGFLGAEKPADVNPGSLEKEVSTKAAVVAQLKKSFAHAKKAVAGVSQDDLTTAIKMFGSDSTKRGAMLTLVEHGSEHLGQSIAYARMAGVVPPWSR
jgi:uncharacterized damage-inducible protein DinB